MSPTLPLTQYGVHTYRGRAGQQNKITILFMALEENNPSTEEIRKRLPCGPLSDEETTRQCQWVIDQGHDIQWCKDWLASHPERKEERIARDCVKLWERDKTP